MLEFHVVTADRRLVERLEDALDRIERAISRRHFTRVSAPPGEEESPGAESDTSIRLTVSDSFDDFVIALDALTIPAKETRSGPNLIVFDGSIVPRVSGGSEIEPPGGREVGFAEWLIPHCPAVPVVILSDEDVSGCPDALVLPGASLRDPAEFARRLAGYLGERLAMPFWSALRAYVTELGRDSWHTPGHGGGRSFARSPFLQSFARAYAPRDSLAFLCDLSVSVDDLGDLSTPYRESPMSRAMARSAATFGAAKTLYATNGSSTSNKVMLMTLLDPGDVVVLDRNCHKSIHQAMVISGTIPLYINPVYNEDLGLSAPIAFEQIAGALTDKDALAALNPRAFCLTTSTYEGVLYPIREIAALCEKAGAIFYADESWLPHGRFHPYYGPRPGGSEGRYNALGTGPHDSAHLVVQSTHKTLSALSQASMMHISPSFMRVVDEAMAAGPDHPFAWLVKRFVDQDDFLDYLAEVARYWVTTSPSYPMIASLDCATTQMAGEGLSVLTRLLAIAGDLHATARRLGAEVDLEALLAGGAEARLFRHDPLKFGVVVKPGRAAPGEPTHLEAFLEILRRRGIAWEKASSGTPSNGGGAAVAGGKVTFLVAAGTGVAHAENLKRALEESRDHLGWADPGAGGCRLRPRFEDQIRVVPRDAHYAEGELVPLREAGGRVSCQMVVPYPPGIPSILPGLEVADHEAARVLEIAKRSESDVHGLVRREREFLIRVLRPGEIAALDQRYAESKPDVKRRLEFLARYRPPVSGTA